MNLQSLSGLGAYKSSILVGGGGGGGGNTTVKPASGSLDTGNALATGLDFFMPILSNTGSPTDIINSTTGTFSGNAAFTSSGTDNGYAIAFDGIDDYVGFTGILSALTGSVTTVFMIAKITGIDTNGTIFWGTNTNNPTFWQLVQPGANGGCYINTAGALTVNGVTWADSTYHTYVFTSDGTTVTAYIDGVNKASSAASSLSQGLFPFVSGAKNFHLGNYIGGSTWDFKGQIAYFGMYGGRCLNSTEVSTLSSAPYALLA